MASGTADSDSVHLLVQQGTPGAPSPAPGPSRPPVRAGGPPIVPIGPVKYQTQRDSIKRRQSQTAIGTQSVLVVAVRTSSQRAMKSSVSCWWASTSFSLSFRNRSSMVLSSNCCQAAAVFHRFCRSWIMLSGIVCQMKGSRAARCVEGKYMRRDTRRHHHSRSWLRWRLWTW